MLIDTFGRVATDLRVSLTDRCNLRCTYCMPEEGLRWPAKPDLLTDDEIVRLIRIAVTDLGVEEVRFTGGEPLLRPGLVGIVERCAALAPRPKLSLTTNGIGLGRTAAALKTAGLDRVNVSQDTLRPAVFPPSAGSSTAALPGSASSPPSPAPSAAPATAPAHRRRPGAHLPVRPGGVRPARSAALRSAGRGDRTAVEARDVGKKAGSGLDEPSFRQPDRPMSAIGG